MLDVLVPRARPAAPAYHDDGFTVWQQKITQIGGSTKPITVWVARWCAERPANKSPARRAGLEVLGVSQAKASVLSAWAEIRAAALDPHKNAECCNGATTRYPPETLIGGLQVSFRDRLLATLWFGKSGSPSCRPSASNWYGTP
jgi:hypothetical protein